MTKVSPPAAPTSTPTSSSHFCPPEQRKYVLIVAIMASAMGFVDSSIVAIAIPQMRVSLDASFSQAQWLTNAYILFLSALMLLGGAAGDRYGLRRAFAFGILLFVAASLLCAMAWSAESLIFFRALQGIGAAIMIPGSMAIISRNYPRAERGRALGIWVSASAMTTGLGPLIGGVVLSAGHAEIWRWIFAINLPFGLLALLILFARVPNDKPKAKVPLDLAGAVLVTLSLASLALGLTLLGEGKDEGLSGLAFPLILAGLVMGAVAIWHELRVAHPMINLRLFSSRVFAGANLLTFLVWAGLGAQLFFLPMVLVTGWKLPEYYAGGLFLPFSLIIAATSPFAGRLVDRYGPRLPLTLGPALAAVGYIAMAAGLYMQSYWFGVLPAIMLQAFATGLSASPVSAAVMLAVEDDQSGAASGINNMIARMSNLIAIAGLGAVAAFVYAMVVRAQGLNEALTEAMIAAGFGERLTGALYQVGAEEAQRLGMTTGLAAMCLIIAAFCIIGACVGWKTQQGREEAGAGR